MELTAMTDVTAIPAATQGWIYPIKTGASGLEAPAAATAGGKITMSAQTVSATNADSVFLIINTTRGTCAAVTWTKADPHVEATFSLPMSAGDELALVQVTEDGTTEFADANFVISI
jgi:hypothetical protein